MRKTAHIKQTFRLDPELVRMLGEHARSHNITQTDVVEAALAALLLQKKDDEAELMLGRRLNRLTRHIDRLFWHAELTNETLALFIRAWLTQTLPLPEDALPAAQASGKQRWAQFIEALARKMEAGPHLVSEIEAAGSAPNTSHDKG